jgi:pilus assembly protein Flp/PilA
MRRILSILLAHRGGATAIEYGLIAALIAVACVGGMVALGSNLGALFNNVAANF